MSKTNLPSKIKKLLLLIGEDETPVDAAIVTLRAVEREMLRMVDADLVVDSDAASDLLALAAVSAVVARGLALMDGGAS